MRSMPSAFTLKDDHSSTELPAKVPRDHSFLTGQIGCHREIRTSGSARTNPVAFFCFGGWADDLRSRGLCRFKTVTTRQQRL